MSFQDYLNEIQKCIDNKCYIASLTLALMIPDICGKALYPNENNSSRYKKWYSIYVGSFLYYKNVNIDDSDKTSWVSADVAYSLRCHMLHEALPNVSKREIKQEENKIDKIHINFSDSAVFFISSTTSSTFGKTVRTMDISAQSLSDLLLRSGKAFYTDNKNEIDKNYTTIIDGFGNKYLQTEE